jgi:hypothetical protein
VRTVIHCHANACDIGTCIRAFPNPDTVYCPDVTV